MKAAVWGFGTLGLWALLCLVLERLDKHDKNRNETQSELDEVASKSTRTSRKRKNITKAEEAAWATS